MKTDFQKKLKSARSREQNHAVQIVLARVIKTLNKKRLPKCDHDPDDENFEFQMFDDAIVIF